MKQLNKLLRAAMLATVIVFSVASCDDAGAGPEKQSFPEGPELPSDMVPNQTSNGYVIQWKGEYTLANGAELSLIKTKSSTENSSGLGFYKRLQLTTYQVTEVSDKTIKIRCIMATGADNAATLDQTYILCTDYTITGRGTGATLTFSGGNVPEISGETWTLK